MKSYFSHSVNNFYGKDLIINNKPVQVRSQLYSKINKSEIFPIKKFRNFWFSGKNIGRQKIYKGFP